MFDSRLSTTGPGSPALASATSSSIARIQPVSSFICSGEGFGLSFGGISPSRICSSDRSHTTGSCFTSTTDVNRSRSRSPFCFFVEWHVMQYSFNNGWMVCWKTCL